ncbi:aminoglycoside phosphotransferase family protein [Cognatiyoonia koreensis]|nr:phosphotransferase [Cognatiyoonia koreensis]
MPDRHELLRIFLGGTVWEDWDQAPIAADASSRRYLRLTHDTQAVMVMDAPPETGEDIEPFCHIANYLESAGLAAPKIYKSNLENGFLVLEDLGRTDFARALQKDPSQEPGLYEAATDVLIRLRELDAPPSVTMNPDVGGEMTRITCEFYVNDPALADEMAKEMAAHLRDLCGPPNILALRDYHAENLIWRPEYRGLQRVGLLDFQDAFLAPDGYDLASLLRDARRDVSEDTVKEVIAYFAKYTQQDEGTVSAAVACLSVQRNLRILGVFARLIRMQGKRRYVQMLPRVWSHVMQDLQHPALHRLNAVLRDRLPEPTDPIIMAWTE